MDNSSHFSEFENSGRSNKMPKGIPYIVGNEAAERFSFYGMKTILFVFFTQFMVNASGESDFLTDVQAKTWIHFFVFGVYFFPIFGALLSDVLWGKYRTIIVLSIVYCAGHIALAMNETRIGMILGLTMIAIGSGGIKPCVSAHVGDQFGKSNSHLISKVFSYFYISINIGAAISQVLTPFLLNNETLIEMGLNSQLAFGIPGALMIIATFVFWLGRTKYTSVPPVDWKTYKAKTFNKEGLRVLGKLASIFVFISVFWCLFDQTASSIIGQAKHQKIDNLVFGLTILPSQVQALNPILVLILVPLFTFVVYPSFEKKDKIKPLSKVTVGMFLTSVSFAILILIQVWLDNGQIVSIAWQFLAYLILTISEVLVSITILEFAYTQAPNESKSLVSSLNLVMVALGNFLTAFFNWLITGEDGQSTISEIEYFSFFTILMFITAILFAIRAKFYTEKTYIQEFSE